jgi:sn-1 stearoyl-lipid 9-desaturase
LRSVRVSSGPLVTLSLVTAPGYARNPFIHRQLQKYYKEVHAFLLLSIRTSIQVARETKEMSETAREIMSEATSQAMTAAGDGVNRRTSSSHDGFNWITGIAMGLFHVGAIAALFFFTWKAFFVAIFLWWISGSLGIGMSYHRLLTHRGYKTPKWVEYFLTWCATLALEGGPIFWVATHRIHHQFSDEDGDPHSPNDGKWWSHMGWILTGKSMHHDTTTLARYVPDLTKDKVHVWLTKYHWTSNVILGVILYAIGGLPFLLWGVFMRTVVGLHSTWMVNSVTHMWGTRRFVTKDLSTNNFLIAVLTFGEGWHNNHHAHPVSARHGLKWYEIDMNWYGIWALKKLGLARHVYKVDLEKLPPKPALVRDVKAAAVLAAAAGND